MIHHPFTDPNTIPLTKYFCKNGYTNNIGIIETNIFAQKLPVDLKFDDDIELTVYNNPKVYKLLSSVIYKKRLKDENNKSKVSG